MLGRLLPRETRERVFDPALGDLMYAWLASPMRQQRGMPFGVRAVATYLGCVPSAVPRLFVERGRLTRVGRVAAWTATVFVALVLVVARMAGTYAATGPTP